MNRDRRGNDGRCLRLNAQFYYELGRAMPDLQLMLARVEQFQPPEHILHPHTRAGLFRIVLLADMDAIAYPEKDRLFVAVKMDLDPGFFPEADPMLEGVLYEGDQEHGGDPVMTILRLDIIFDADTGGRLGPQLLQGNIIIQVTDLLIHGDEIVIILLEHEAHHVAKLLHAVRCPRRSFL